MLNTKFFEIVRRAGELMRSYSCPAVRQKEGHADFVTEADEAVQAYLMEALHRQIPSAAFLAEEGEHAALTDALTFIIDPIDGTTNYFRGRRSSVISVGLVEGKRAVAGAVYDPYHDLMYHAERGQGAWCEGERLRVSELPIGQALVELGTSPYHTDLNALTAHALEKLLPRVADVRRSGSAALDLCHVASGTAEGMFEWLLQPWDYCAGSLLVEEAGGKAGNIFGGEATFSEGIPFMAGSAVCFEALRQILWEARDEIGAKGSVDRG